MQKVTAIQALIERLVLVGRNLGKTFFKGEAIKRCRESKKNIDIVSSDMRDANMLGKYLITALDVQRQKSLKWATELLRTVIAHTTTIITGQRYRSRQRSKGSAGYCSPSKKRINIENFSNKITRSGRIPSLIVDEANLALPGLSNDANTAAKSALHSINAFISWNRF